MYLTNPKNNLDSILSDFNTDEDAKTALVDRISRGEFSDIQFPSSLVVAFYSGSLSDARKYWLHKLAMGQTVRVQEPASLGNLSRLEAIFDTAKAKLKKPAVLLKTADGVQVKIAPFGPNSKYSGSLCISSPKYGGGYYGRITDGRFFEGKQDLAGLLKLLRAFAENPEKVAASQGQEHGSCCFCSKPLKDQRSLDVGYGQICANRYGLVWGTYNVSAEDVKSEDN